MKTCVIKWNYTYQAHEAFNEDGVVVMRRASLGELQFALWQKGYVEVSLNSRAGRTILDKIEGQHI